MARNGSLFFLYNQKNSFELVHPIELAATGTVPNETTMQAWKVKKDAEWKASKMIPEKSEKLKELEAKANA